MESPILTAILPAMAAVGRRSRRTYDHEAIRAYVAGGRTIDEAVARFGCSKTLAYNVAGGGRTDRRAVPRAIDARFALALSPVEPPPVWHNGVDVADVDRCLDRGERLRDIARYWDLPSVVVLVGKAAGGPGAISLAEADRRLKANEGPTSVAFRARVGNAAALYRRLEGLELDRRIEEVDAAEREAAEAASEDAAIPAPKAKRVYPKLTSREVWPEERVDALADLWAEDLSASIIAARMGLTKSQVVGMAKRRRDAGDSRFPSRLVEEPADKVEARQYLGRRARTMLEDVEFGTWVATSKRLGLLPNDVSGIKNGEWYRFSPARLLQILGKLGAEVEVTATITLNGVAEAVVLPLAGRSPI